MTSDHGGVLLHDENISTEDWLQLRTLGIGGSDVAAVVGISPWDSPYSLWLVKTGRAESEDLSDNDAVYWGNMLEPLVLAEVTRRVPGMIEAKTGGGTFRHETHKFMLANPDGIGVHETKGTVLIECKTAGFRAAYMWEDDQVPENYVLQVQHSLEVLSLEWALVVVLIAGRDYEYRWVRRDTYLMANVIKLERKFWEENVKQDIPPALTSLPSDSDGLKKQFKGGGKKKTLPTDVTTKVESARLLKQQMKELEESYDQLTNEIKFALGDDEVGLNDDGDSVVTWRTSKTGRRTFRLS